MPDNHISFDSSLFRHYVIIALIRLFGTLKMVATLGQFLVDLIIGKEWAYSLIRMIMMAR